MPSLADRRRAYEDRLALLAAEGPAPLARPKLFLCGREYAGKTTLLHSLGRTCQPTDVDESQPRDTEDIAHRTVSVEVGPLSLGDKEFSVWDYGGQLDFYATHELFLADESAIFVVMCALDEEAEKCEAKLLYWLRFLRARFGAGACPKVVLVGTCADLAHRTLLVQQDDDRFKSAWGGVFITRAREIFAGHLAIHPELLILDVRKSQSAGVVALRMQLLVLHAMVLEQAVTVPKISQDVIKALPGAREKAPTATRTEFMQLMRGMSGGTEDWAHPLCGPLLRFVGGSLFFHSSAAIMSLFPQVSRPRRGGHLVRGRGCGAC
jgi:GTPase SAR1 family protein